MFKESGGIAKEWFERAALLLWLRRIVCSLDLLPVSYLRYDECSISFGGLFLKTVMSDARLLCSDPVERPEDTRVDLDKVYDISTASGISG
jgi:hypothetical protein